MNDQAVSTASDSFTETQQFRSQVGHISRHSGVLVTGTIFTVALGYIFKVYLARTLGAETLGIYALGMTLVGFVGIFNSLGLVESAVRFAAVYRATGRLPQLRALLWWGSAVLLGVNVLFAAIFLKVGKVAARNFYHSPMLARYIPWFAVLMLLGVISTFYGMILVGYKAVGRRTLITSFIGTPATMLCALLLISTGWGLRGYLVAQVLGSVLVIVLLLIVVWRLTPCEARFLLPTPNPLEREVWSFSAAATGVLLLVFLMNQVDKIALGFYLGPRSVGVYSIAATVVAYVTLGLNSVNQVFSPIIADLHARGDRAMLGRLYKALTKWVTGLTLPLAIAVMVCARPLMRIFGSDFESGWPILIIGTAGQLVNCGVGSVGLLLLMSGNQRRLLRVQAAMAAVMIIASIALIPIWGIIGAAVAAAITNAGTNLWNLMEVRQALGMSPYNRSYFRLLPAAVATLAATLILKQHMGILRHDWLAVGAVVGLAYSVFAGMTVAVGLDADDWLIVAAIRSRICALFAATGAEMRAS